MMILYSRSEISQSSHKLYELDSHALRAYKGISRNLQPILSCFNGIRHIVTLPSAKILPIQELARINMIQNFYGKINPRLDLSSKRGLPLITLVIISRMDLLTFLLRDIRIVQNLFRLRYGGHKIMQYTSSDELQSYHLALQLHV